MNKASQISITRSPQGPHGLLQPSTTHGITRTLDKQVFLNTELSLHPDIIANPFTFVNNLSKCNAAIFNYFLMLSFRCRHLYATQEHIAKKTNACRRTVRRAVRKFEELGILITRHRPYTSNEYRFNPYFYRPEVLSIIRSISQGAKFISIELLKPFSRREANELEKTGSNSKCPPKTLPVSLYISVRKVGDQLRNNSARARKRWALPRPMTPIEARETRMHNENNTAMRKNPFSSTINRIGLLLNLTAAGKVDISRYPEESLLHAESLYGRAGSKAQDKLKWFHYICVQYCKERHIKVDHHYARHLAQYFGVAESDDKVNLPSKLNSDKRYQSFQYSETGRVDSVCPDGSSSLSTQNKTYDFKTKTKEGDYIDSSLHMPSGSSLPSAALHQRSGLLSSSETLQYNAVTGQHCKQTTQVSSRVRSSGGPRATQDEVDAAIKNILDNVLRGVFG